MAENSYPINLDSFIKASFGTYTIMGTSESTKRAHALKIESDAVFSSIKVNDSSTNVRSTYLDSVGGTVPKGTLITAGEDNIFTGVTLTSGVVTQLLAEPSEPSL